MASVSWETEDSRIRLQTGTHQIEETQMFHFYVSGLVSKQTRKIPQARTLEPAEEQLRWHATLSDLNYGRLHDEQQLSRSEGL